MRRWTTSIPEHVEMREIFGQFAIEGVETTYTLCTAATGGGLRAGELIVQSCR